MNEDEIEEPEPTEDSVNFQKLKTEIASRSKVAGIKIEEDVDFFEDSKALKVLMPSGRESVELYISEESEAEAFLSVEFEKYRMLGEYMGIYSYEKGTIETSIRTVGLYGPSSRYLRQKLFECDLEDTSKFEPIILKQDQDEESITIQIGEISDELAAIYGMRARMRNRLSLRITNTKLKTHDGTIRLLEKFANSVFFQIDLQLSIPLSLQRERARTRGFGRRGEPGSRAELKFPDREYDQQPISLYWYAKSAIGLPLLQFLAYYQVLEFFMPTYSNHEAVGKVKNILKDPRFNPEKDSQVARILATLRPSKRGFGDERTQFEAVIRKCVSQEELRDYFESHARISEYYNTGYKPISEKKIPINNKESDLILETALRLYEIRCRIVHTKDQSDKEVQLLLPFSKETTNLHYDIALIEFIATSVLIASSAPIKTTI